MDGFTLTTIMKQSLREYQVIELESVRPQRIGIDDVNKKRESDKNESENESNKRGENASAKGRKGKDGDKSGRRWTIGSVSQSRDVSKQDGDKGGSKAPRSGKGAWTWSSPLLCFCSHDGHLAALQALALRCQLN